MRYTINYCGAVFINYSDGFNCFETNNFQQAKEILYHIVQNGADIHAYLKDEDYQCSMYWNEKEKNFIGIKNCPNCKKICHFCGEYIRFNRLYLEHNGA